MLCVLSGIGVVSEAIIINKLLVIIFENQDRKLRVDFVNANKEI